MKANSRVFSYLATFGALITVVAMAVDPFSQQVLQYYGCLNAVPESVARVPRANNYSAESVLTFGASRSYSLQPPMLAAMYVGLVKPPQNVSSALSVQCETGNCTFPADSGAAYTTLSMCNSCTDITKSIVLNNDTSVYNWSLPCLPSQKCASISAGGAFSCQTEGPGPYDSFFTLECLMLSNGKPCDGEVPTVCPPTVGFATRCSYVPCIREYTAQMTNFVLEEKLISTTNLAVVPGNASTGRDAYFSIATNSTLRNGVRHECSSEHWTEDTPVAVSENNTMIPYDSGVEPAYWVSADCAWYVDEVTTSLVAGSLMGFYDQESIYMPYGDPYSTAGGSVWSTNLYQNASSNLTSVTRYMDGLAESMSAEMRQGGALADGQVRSEALGVVMRSQTCIGVRWAWLTLPAALIALTMAFLAATVWCSRTPAWHGMWKSSSLALLFHNVKSKTLQQDGLLDSKSQINETASKMNVQFMQTERGWSFLER